MTSPRCTHRMEIGSPQSAKSIVVPPIPFTVSLRYGAASLRCLILSGAESSEARSSKLEMLQNLYTWSGQRQHASWSGIQAIPTGPKNFCVGLDGRTFRLSALLTLLVLVIPKRLPSRIRRDGSLGSGEACRSKPIGERPSRDVGVLESWMLGNVASHDSHGKS